MNIDDHILDIIKQLIDVSHSEDIFREERIALLTPIRNLSEGPTGDYLPEFTFLVDQQVPEKYQVSFSDIAKPITSELLYPLYLDLQKEEFIVRFNKTIYEYIQRKLAIAVENNVSSTDSIWNQPNAAFMNWFQEKNINIKKVKSLIRQGEIPAFLSKWGQEVVRLLIKNGKMKHQDILLALVDSPNSYNHISKIFKSRDAKKFFKNEIINNGSYYSLRDPSQFK